MSYCRLCDNIVSVNYKPNPPTGFCSKLETWVELDHKNKCGRFSFRRTSSGRLAQAFSSNEELLASALKETFANKVIIRHG